jgi:hypothetical protein
MQEEVSHLAKERDEIARLIQDKGAKLSLRGGDTALDTLRTKKTDLEHFITRIEGVQKEAASAATLGLAKMLERARLFEAEADFDQAIALYEKVLKASPEQRKVKDHLAKLKADWSLKDHPKHKDARAFLVSTWPRLEVPELKNKLDKAHEALAVCKIVGDKLTPLKVVQADIAHAAHLTKYLDTLKRQDSVDNRAQAKAVGQVIEGLARLHQEATALAGKK